MYDIMEEKVVKLWKLTKNKKENWSMKKFITTSPLQEILSCVEYVAVDNKALQFNRKTRFPVIPLLNAYAEAGEEIELIVLCHKGHEDRSGEYRDPSGKNFELLKEEVEELRKEKKFECVIKKIEMEYNECINEHLKNFEHLIEQIEDEDELYACMSYGTKAVPIIEMMALNYAHRAKFNTHIA